MYRSVFGHIVYYPGGVYGPRDGCPLIIFTAAAVKQISVCISHRTIGTAVVTPVGPSEPTTHGVVVCFWTKTDG